MQEVSAFKVVTPDDWIAELPAPVRAAIVERMTVTAMPAGATIARAGDPGVSLFQVREGYVRLEGLHENGNESLITIFMPGNCFGESVLIAKRRRHHTTVALTDVRIGELAERDFWDLYHAHWQIPEALCRKFVAQISRQIASRETRASFKLGRRIAMMFENFVDHCPGPPHPDGATFDFPITQWDIAALFDVTRQSVHREIAQLRTLGAVDKRDGVWIVTDRAMLRRYGS